MSVVDQQGLEQEGFEVSFSRISNTPNRAACSVGKCRRKALFLIVVSPIEQDDESSERCFFMCHDHLGQFCRDFGIDEAEAEVSANEVCGHLH